MKFEHVLQIYWSKGFLCAGKLHPFDITFREFAAQIHGFSRWFRYLIVKRFELLEQYLNVQSSFANIGSDYQTWINVILSKSTSVNYKISELEYYDKVRLYLVKSYRGRAHALGKPSRGQRTWSNAWTAYHSNRTVRSYVASVQKDLAKNARVEKINYKKLKKKVRHPASNAPSRKLPIKKKNMWF